MCHMTIINFYELSNVCEICTIVFAATQRSINLRAASWIRESTDIP